jgi:hypothetical protein
MIHDYLHEAHQLVQAGDESQRTAAYWHAIMHRREPDYSNSRYWFRRVGVHPVFEDIASELLALRNDDKFWSCLGGDRLLDKTGQWNAMAFVDLCQECGADWSERAQAAARVQEIEMRRLLEYSCR